MVLPCSLASSPVPRGSSSRSLEPPWMTPNLSPKPVPRSDSLGASWVVHHARTLDAGFPRRGIGWARLPSETDAARSVALELVNEGHPAIGDFPEACPVRREHAISLLDALAPSKVCSRGLRRDSPRRTPLPPPRCVAAARSRSATCPHRRTKLEPATSGATGHFEDRESTRGQMPRVGRRRAGASSSPRRLPMRSMRRVSAGSRIWVQARSRVEHDARRYRIVALKDRAEEIASALQVQAGNDADRASVEIAALTIARVEAGHAACARTGSRPRRCPLAP